MSGVTKSFGAKLVLDDISVSARSGEALGLLGRNGAGKTTSLRIIMGVFPPDKGSVTVDGVSIPNDKIKVGYLPEERGLYPKKPIAPQLAYLAELRGLRAAEAKKAVSRWLERVDMQEYANKQLDTLSKGNQQKIQLAATLLTDPDIVILDEPFSGLDPVNSYMLQGVVKQLVQDGKCVIFSSHQMGYIDELCKSIAIIHGGKIVISGELSGIKRNYERDRVIVKMDPQRVSSARALFTDKFTRAGIISAVIEKDFGFDIKLANAGGSTRLLRAVTESGCEIEGFALYEPTLNDIFIKYTGEAEVQ